MTVDKTVLLRVTFEEKTADVFDSDAVEVRCVVERLRISERTGELWCHHYTTARKLVDGGLWREDPDAWRGRARDEMLRECLKYADVTK